MHARAIILLALFSAGSAGETDETPTKTDQQSSPSQGQGSSTKKTDEERMGVTFGNFGDKNVVQPAGELKHIVTPAKEEQTFLSPNPTAAFNRKMEFNPVEGLKVKQQISETPKQGKAAGLVNGHINQLHQSQDALDLERFNESGIPKRRQEFLEQVFSQSKEKKTSRNIGRNNYMSGLSRELSRESEDDHMNNSQISANPRLQMGQQQRAAPGQVIVMPSNQVPKDFQNFKNLRLLKLKQKQVLLKNQIMKPLPKQVDPFSISHKRNKSKPTVIKDFVQKVNAPWKNNHFTAIPSENLIPGEDIIPQFMINNDMRQQRQVERRAPSLQRFNVPRRLEVPQDTPIDLSQQPNSHVMHALYEADIQQPRSFLSSRQSSVRMGGLSRHSAMQSQHNISAMQSQPKIPQRVNSGMKIHMPRASVNNGPNGQINSHRASVNNGQSIVQMQTQRYEKPMDIIKSAREQAKGKSSLN